MIFGKVSADALKPLELWCSCCDGPLVKSNDTNTGSFYNMFGIEWRPMPWGHNDPRDRPIGGNKQIIFALCPRCEEKMKQCECCEERQMFSEVKKMWLDDDDSRGCPSGWIRARDIFEAIEIVKFGDIAEMSLDHDIESPCFGYGEGRNLTGEDFVKWMFNNLPPSKWPHTIHIHSMNPVGAEKMEALLLTFAPRFTMINRQSFSVEMINSLEK